MNREKGNGWEKQSYKDSVLLISFRKSQGKILSLSPSRSCMNFWSIVTTITNLSAFSQQQWAVCWASPCRCQQPQPSPPDRSSPRPEVCPELAWNKSKIIKKLQFLPQAQCWGVVLTSLWMRLIWMPSTIRVEKRVTVTLMYWRLTCFHSTSHLRDNSSVSVRSEICCLAARKKPS